jgi:hypothetical protein
MGLDLLEAHRFGVSWRDSVTEGCRISVDDSTAVCTEIDAAVDARIAGDGGVGKCEFEPTTPRDHCSSQTPR